jgi:response regulator NasT
MAPIVDDNKPRILIIDDNAERATVLRSGLEDTGFNSVVELGQGGDLIAQIRQIDPDVILIDLENPRRDTVEQMFRVSREVHRPIAMFVDESDQETMTAAIKAGVSAYVVDGLKRERIKPIVDLAISRFDVYSELQARAEFAEAKLEERKVIDRAKSILMSKRGMSEQEAYRMLQSNARSRNKRIIDIATSVITADEIGV